MKTNFKLALAVLAGVAIGAAVVSVNHAQQAKTPPAYVIAEVEVTDHEAIQRYGAKVPDTLAPYNHHYVVRGGKTEALEGDQPKGIVIIGFDSAEDARAWYHSPAYEAIKTIRQSAAKSRLYIVEGIPPQ